MSITLVSTAAGMVHAGSTYLGRLKAGVSEAPAPGLHLESDSFVAEMAGPLNRDLGPRTDGRRDTREIMARAAKVIFSRFPDVGEWRDKVHKRLAASTFMRVFNDEEHFGRIAAGLLLFDDDDSLKSEILDREFGRLVSQGPNTAAYFEQHKESLVRILTAIVTDKNLISKFVLGNNANSQAICLMMNMLVEGERREIFSLARINMQECYNERLAEGNKQYILENKDHETHHYMHDLLVLFNVFQASD